ncbi:uncharacterized protein BDZ99DRAFT_511399 [Mytilinidion resinicola]|uniref:Twin-arginine translocation pathway signal n=1 Tax=Mytilinidion resinicola TaxID=574789 RepID=A0A6A6Y7J8_9PEZI|nr:uncharacterized protein BDZ99DRAFT_511399 [Mytilinidion resinicola]KAF2804796.1 hypothetical protein BDZ99DRAFT_511399 [Mytilinidion resinicola]
MPSLRKILKYLFALGPVVSALPAPVPKPGSVLKPYPRARLDVRQAASQGLNDVDILQFALTAEHLEATFYRQGFAKFPASDFQALGLSDASITALLAVGQSEATHVSTLLSAIATAGFEPVEPCVYNFGFTDAAGMVATARILEAVGLSAYLGAAPLINSSAILSVAATIATVEARHQTFIRVASSADPVPAAFDTPLGPRAVFTLAAQFITSCPAGSNLAIQAFPSIALQNPMNAVAGQSLVLADASQPAGATNCAFIGPTGTQFSDLTNGACVVPQGLGGETYMMVTNAQSIADEAVLAGPSVILAS